MSSTTITMTNQRRSTTPSTTQPAASSSNQPEDEKREDAMDLDPEEEETEEMREMRLAFEAKRAELQQKAKAERLRKAAEAEQKRKDEEERKRKDEEERQRKAEEDRQRKADEDRRRVAQEKADAAEAERKEKEKKKKLKAKSGSPEQTKKIRPKPKPAVLGVKKGAKAGKKEGKTKSKVSSEIFSIFGANHSLPKETISDESDKEAAPESDGKAKKASGSHSATLEEQRAIGEDIRSQIRARSEAAAVRRLPGEVSRALIGTLQVVATPVASVSSIRSRKSSELTCFLVAERGEIRGEDRRQTQGWRDCKSCLFIFYMPEFIPTRFV